VTLADAEEELASFYAAMPDDGPQLGNPKTRVKFQKNFFDDFKEVLGASHVVQKFELCDFSLIRSHLDLQKSLRKAATDEEKQEKKKLKDQVTLKYGYAMIDGRLEKVRKHAALSPRCSCYY
jgi:DNA topoisomerase-1